MDGRADPLALHIAEALSTAGVGADSRKQEDIDIAFLSQRVAQALRKERLTPDLWDSAAFTAELLKRALDRTTPVALSSDDRSLEHVVAFLARNAQAETFVTDAACPVGILNGLPRFGVLEVPPAAAEKSVLEDKEEDEFARHVKLKTGERHWLKGQTSKTERRVNVQQQLALRLRGATKASPLAPVIDSDSEKEKRRLYLETTAVDLVELEQRILMQVRALASDRYPDKAKSKFKYASNTELRRTFEHHLLSTIGAKDNIALVLVFTRMCKPAAIELLQEQLSLAIQLDGDMFEQLAVAKRVREAEGTSSHLGAKAGNWLFNLTKEVGRPTVGPVKREGSKKRVAGEKSQGQRIALEKFNAALRAAAKVDAANGEIDMHLSHAKALQALAAESKILGSLCSTLEIERAWFGDSAAKLHLNDSEQLPIDARADLRALKMGIWRVQIVFVLQVDKQVAPVFDWSQIRVALVVGDTLFDWNPTSMVLSRNVHQSEFVTSDEESTSAARLARERHTIIVPLGLGGDRFLRQEDITPFCAAVQRFNSMYYYCASKSAVAGASARDSIDFVAEVLTSIEKHKHAIARREGDQDAGDEDGEDDLPPSSVRVDEFFPPKIQLLLKRTLHDRSPPDGSEETAALSAAAAAVVDKESRLSSFRHVSPVNKYVLDADARTIRLELEPVKLGAEPVVVDLSSHAHLDELFDETGDSICDSVHGTSSGLDIGGLEFVDVQALRCVDRLFWIRFLWALYGRHAVDTSELSAADARYIPHVNENAASSLGSTFNGSQLAQSYNCPFGVPLTSAKSRQEQFDKHEELGRGASATAFRVTHRPTGKQFCLKVVNKRDTTFGDAELIRTLEREVVAMQSVRHEHIVRLYFYWESALELFLVMQLADGGALTQAVSPNGSGSGSTLSQERARQISFQLLSALAYLHARGVMHRDIKPDNVLLDKSGKVLVADLGLAKSLKKKSDPAKEAAPCPFSFLSNAPSSVDTAGARSRRAYHTVVGTADFMSPELMSQSGSYDESVDLWATGLVVFYCCVGRNMYANLSRAEAEESIMKGVLYLDDVPYAGARELIRRLCAAIPAERIRAIVALDDPWITGKREHGRTA